MPNTSRKIKLRVDQVDARLIATAFKALQVVTNRINAIEAGVGATAMVVPTHLYLEFADYAAQLKGSELELNQRATSLAVQLDKHAG